MAAGVHQAPVPRAGRGAWYHAQPNASPPPLTV